MFSGKVCQYLESKYADPVRAGKKKTTLHFSNACILQSVRSNFLKFFECHLVVVNLKILRLKRVKSCFNQSYSVTSLKGSFEVFLCEVVKDF